MSKSRPSSKEQIIIVCDNNGIKTGKFIAKEAGHTGDGKHHLAITVLLINSKGEVLTQKRKHKRFDSLWDLTGATDLYHFEDGKDETFEEAALRCLKKEWGIREIGKIRAIGGFNYFARWGQYCENEYCAMLTANYDREVNMNPEVGYEYRWVSRQELLDDIEQNPQNYTPWAIDGVKILKKAGFFATPLD